MKTATVKKTFPVTGMSCASCAANVEATLVHQPGVVHANVNFANSTANVEYVPGVAEPAKLRSAVQSAGYDMLTDETANAGYTFAEIQKKNYEALRRRTVWAILFSMPIVVIGMFFVDIPYGNYIMWALATPVVAVFGQQFFTGAWKQAKHGSANMDTLVALSTGVAYLFSVFNTVCPQYWHSRGLHADVYFEAAAVVVAFILLGKMLEEKAKSSTSSAIKKLMGLQPDTVTVVRGAETVELPTAQVQVNDIIQIKPGAKIPVDGIVTNGSSYVDESMISGEPIPLLKEAGAKVFTGTINQKGSFLFRAEKVGGDTVLAQIIRLVQQAQGSKAPVQKLVDKVAGIFVPVVMGIAVLSLIAWIVAGGDNAVTHGLLAMVTVLVVACPCALGLATPTAIMVGMGKGAENGILIKDAESLELAHKLNVIVLDKTGTITEGYPEVAGIAWKDDAQTEKLASILLGIEQQSEHPLAAAVSRYFAALDIPRAEVSNFESVTGEGVTATYYNKNYFIGSSRFMEQKKISIPHKLIKQAEDWISDAYTIIWFADQWDALGAVAIADKIKPDSPAAVARLQQMGIEVYMLTGDSEHTAKAVAEKAGITNYRAGMLPADKAALIKELQQQGKTVGMVGDGINDSHALAQADVSIAMGRGTDIAIDVARMTIISGNLLQIPKAILLSRKTVRLINQNLFWAFIYNLVGIPIAAGILYPFTGFMLHPMFAGAAMALSSVSVVSNSLRLKLATL